MKDFGLYLIITQPELPLETIARHCVQMNVRCLQLREKHLTDREILAAAAKIRAVTKGTSTLFFINDRVDLALAAGADGVHLGRDDLSAGEARRIAGERRLLVGLSTHSPDQARAALAEKPDYIGFGPIYPTPTKAKPDPVVGVGQLRRVLSWANCPVVAIGGIDGDNLENVLSAGARNVCLVRYLMQTKRLAERIGGIQARLGANTRPPTSAR